MTSDPWPPPKRRRRLARPLCLAIAGLTFFCPLGSVEAAPSSICEASPGSAATDGPLTHSSGHSHFSDNTGRRVYLTGSHTWDSLQDYGEDDPRPDFDYCAFLDQKIENGHNFIRLWAWESTSIGDPDLPFEDFQPMPWIKGRDGRFDLYSGDVNQPFDDSEVNFNPEYFDRLWQRVNDARERGIYVGVMLFQGWSVYYKGFQATQDWCPFRDHPLKLENNSNGVDADINDSGHSVCGGSDGEELHTLSLEDPGSDRELLITNFQKAYVKKTVDTLKNLDNVLYEISNESICGGNFYPTFCTASWQEEMVTFIKGYQRDENLQRHPVGMTAGAGNDDLFASSADWVSPGRGGTCNTSPAFDYALDPPEHDGSKVIIADTDHINCIRAQEDNRYHRQWTWKSLTRGYNPIAMDAAQNPFSADPGPGADPDNEIWPDVRRYLGEARSYAQRLDLAVAVPNSALCGMDYCLADPGRAYLVYQPDSPGITVNLEAGTYDVEWFNPRDGQVFVLPPVTSAGDARDFSRPAGFSCGSGEFLCDAVLLLDNGCSPPGGGDWHVTASCTFEGTATAPAKVIVENNAVLTIASGAVLDIDFASFHLLVENGSQVVVKNGGQIN